MDPEIQALKAKLQKLQDDLDSVNALLSRHQHRGSDGSSRISGDLLYQASSMTVGSGAASTQSGEQYYFPAQIAFEVGSDIDRDLAYGGAVGATLADKDLADAERVVTILAAAKTKNAALGSVDSILLGDAAGAPIDQSVLYIDHYTNLWATLNYGIFFGTRNSYAGTGAISGSKLTITDTQKKWATDELVGAHVYLNDAGVIQDRVVTSNTATVLTVDAAFTFASGSYDYEAFYPMYNGFSNHPWQRVYVGTDFRWGYGPTAGETARLWTYVPNIVDNPPTTWGPTVRMNTTIDAASTGVALGTLSNPWGQLYVVNAYLSGDLTCDDLLPASTTNSYIGGSGAEWLRAYIGNIYYGSTQYMNFSNGSAIYTYTDILPQGSTDKLGSTSDEWYEAYIEKIIGNEGANVLDMSNNGYLATNQVFKLVNSAGMPSVSQPGAIAYNSSTGKLVFRDGSNWRTVTST